jgi:hypothetical protein
MRKVYYRRDTPPVQLNVEKAYFSLPPLDARQLVARGWQRKVERDSEISDPWSNRPSSINTADSFDRHFVGDDGGSGFFFTGIIAIMKRLG